MVRAFLGRYLNIFRFVAPPPLGELRRRGILCGYFVTVFARSHYQSAPLPLTRGSCWGVVQLVGHLTVNEDGEGSNPSAPAKLTDFTATYFFHFYQKARFYQLN